MAGPPFPGGLYRTFRPQQDAAGLEALDSGCDLVKCTDFEQVKVMEGNAVFDVAPMIGFRAVRPVDRVRLSLTQLLPTTQATQPPALPANIRIAIRLSHSGCGEVWFNKIIVPVDYGARGLIVQLAGLLFDTCEIYAGLPVADPNNGGGLLMVLRCIIDRCGCCAEDTPHEVDGPLVYSPD